MSFSCHERQRTPENVVLGGGEAGEVVAVVQTARLAGLAFTGLRDAILTHPTMAKGRTVLFANDPPFSAA